MIEVGKTYTTLELAQALGISKSTFMHKRDQYLQALSEAYTYKVSQKGRATYYTITEQVGEYIKPKRKNTRERTYKILCDFILTQVRVDNLQTAANLNHIAWENSDTNPSEIVQLRIKDTTSYQYFRVVLRDMFGTKKNEGGTHGIISKKVWCYKHPQLNKYIPLDDEAKKFFVQCFNNAKEKHKKLDMEICGDYDIGLITKEEMNARLGENTFQSWQSAKQIFYDRYHYFPICVPQYEIRAWSEGEKS